MIRFTPLLLCALMAATAAPAQSTDQTPRPVAAVTPVSATPALDLSGVRPVLRPTTAPAVTLTLQHRPQLRPQSEQARVMQASLATPGLSPDVSIFPPRRDDELAQQILFKKRKERRAQQRALEKGKICGNIAIQGEVIGRVPGKRAGCGVQNAVRVRSVSGVKLSTASTMDCTTAQALNRWVESGLKPAFKPRGEVVQMKVAAHYACRTRNNRPGAKISEHGKGKAIDLSAFTLEDGEVVTVLKGWGKGGQGRALRKAWKAACGPFGTVLGPQADRYHRDHFHFDTAKHRGGSYCR